jgi:RNase P/RNase MRP subunit POP5
MPVRGVRRRYLHIVVKTSAQPTKVQIDETIRRSLLSLFGLKGLSEVDLLLTDFNELERNGIVRCSHLGLRSLRAAIAFITSINAEASVIHVDCVSGTIKRLKKKTGETIGKDNH